MEKIMAMQTTLVFFLAGLSIIVIGGAITVMKLRYERE
jgi:hypothetical protein